MILDWSFMTHNGTLCAKYDDGYVSSGSLTVPLNTINGGISQCFFYFWLNRGKNSLQKFRRFAAIFYPKNTLIFFPPFGRIKPLQKTMPLNMIVYCYISMCFALCKLSAPQAIFFTFHILYTNFP